MFLFSDARLDEYQLPFAEMVGADVKLKNMVEVVALKQCRPHLPGTEHEVSLPGNEPCWMKKSEYSCFQ